MSDFELLPLLEWETSLTVLLAPFAILVRVANRRVGVAVRVETWVDVHGDVLLVRANVECKAAADRHKHGYYHC